MPGTGWGLLVTSTSPPQLQVSRPLVPSRDPQRCHCRSRRDHRDPPWLDPAPSCPLPSVQRHVSGRPLPSRLLQRRDLAGSATQLLDQRGLLQQLRQQQRHVLRGAGPGFGTVGPIRPRQWARGLRSRLPGHHRLSERPPAPPVHEVRSRDCHPGPGVASGERRRGGGEGR